MSWPSPDGWRPPRRFEEPLTPRAEVDECRAILGQPRRPWYWLEDVEPEDWVRALDEVANA